MEKKDKILLIFFSTILVLFIPVCIFAGFRYFGKSNDNNKTNEKEEQKENLGNKEENKEEIEEQVIINYPREMTSDEYNIYGDSFISSIENMSKTLDESIKDYKEKISFADYKHNTWIEVNDPIRGTYMKKVTLKNGKITTSSKQNAPTLVGIEGTPVAIEKSCYNQCDIFILTEEGKLYYSYVEVDRSIKDIQTLWTFNEIVTGEKVNKIKAVDMQPFYNYRVFYPEVQLESHTYKPYLLFETNSGVYYAYSNNKGGINIPEKTIDKSFDFVVGIPFITETKGNYYLAINLNKNVEIVEATGVDFKSKSLLTSDNKKIVVKQYFVVYDRADGENIEYAQNVIYFISEDNYLYYYVGGDELKKLDEPKIKKIEVKEESSSTVIEITFEGSDNHGLRFKIIEEEYIEDDGCYDEEFCD